MRSALAIWLILSATASAQIGGGTGGMGGGGSGFGGSSGSGGRSTSGQSGLGSLDLGTFGSTPAPLSNIGRSTVISQTNPFSSTYGNPYAMGVTATNSVSGFGAPVFNSTSVGGFGTAGGTGNRTTGGFGTTGTTSGGFGTAGGTGNRTTGGFGNTGGGFGGSTLGGGTGSTLGGLGGTTGFGGNTGNRVGGLGNTGGFGTATTNTGAFGGTTGLGGNLGNRAGGTLGGLGNTGMLTGSTSAAASGLKAGVLYSTVIRFPVNTTPVEVVRTELSNVLASSTSLSAPANVRLEMDAGVVVLRGRVASWEEARHAENLIRLSPGVRDVRNELQFPNP